MPTLRRYRLRPPEPAADAEWFDRILQPADGAGTFCRGHGRVAGMAIGYREIIIILVLGIGLIIWLARRKN